MNAYLLLELTHILSATLLFGTGLGTAFFMLMAHRSRNPQVIHATARHVVWADWLFTTPAVIIQPLTGVLLMRVLGYSFDSPWFYSVAGLYLVAGLCWIPVVRIQYRLRELSRDCHAAEGLPAEFGRLMRVWAALGAAAFSAVLGLFVLMIFKPWLG